MAPSLVLDRQPVHEGGEYAARPHLRGAKDVAATQLSLLGGFSLCVGGRGVDLSLSSQRVLAFVALRERPVMRSYVAGTLWMDHTEERAAANLRSALWRLSQSGGSLVCSSGRMLQLAPDVVVDTRKMVDRARCTGERPEVDLAIGAVDAVACSHELLPDWYDEWVILDRERLRQIQLHILDAMCAELTTRGRFLDAIDIGLLAIATEPLRESAHRAVIRVHLAEGNVGEAQRQYSTYAALVRESLNLAPSPMLQQMMRDAGCSIG